MQIASKNLPDTPSFRSCFEIVPEFYYAEFSRQFRLWKRERSGGYVTDDKDENGRKGRVRKERNYFKTASQCSWISKVMSTPPKCPAMLSVASM